MKRSLGAKTILYPTPTLLVGTYDEADKPNLMTAAWGGICNSRPPCIYVSLRKATYSHHCILANHGYTVSVLSENHVRQADYCGIASGRDANKFEVTGLTPVASDLVHAPYVAEAPLVIECRLVQALELGLHTQFIGEVLDVKAEDDVLDRWGRVDVAKLRPIIFAPDSREYYGLGEFLGKAFEIGKELQER
jgi:flavin reductase (DIM6/NTAB) family NADH-FMN oxidoreductase RutF